MPDRVKLCATVTPEVRDRFREFCEMTNRRQNLLLAHMVEHFLENVREEAKKVKREK